MNTIPRRPVFRAPGGKFRIAKWIVDHRPAKYGFYVETHCFAASVFFHMPKKSGGEVINDINDQVTDTFQVLRDETAAAELQRQLRLTPLSYTEYQRSYQYPPTEDKVEMARRLIFQSFATIGTDGIIREKSGFRGIKNKESNITAAQEWDAYPDAIPAFTQRLKGVIIENRPALDIIDVYDDKETFFYLDPPYPHNARSRGRNYYRYEMTWKDHVELAKRLQSIKGVAIISSYDTPEYRALFPGWRMDWKGARTQGNFKRVEAIWMSPKITNQMSF